MSEKIDFERWSNSATTVLLGPLGSTAESWRWTDIEGVRIEYPGHGQRERSPGWTFRSFAEQILDEVAGPLDLIGVGAGGAIAGSLAVWRPERIRSAIILCSGLGLDPSAGGTADKVPPTGGELVGSADGDLVLVAAVKQTLRRWFAAYTRRIETVGVRFAREMLLAMNAEAWNDAVQAEAAFMPPSLAEFSQVTAPVTIVGGTLDQVVGLTWSKRLQAVMPHSRCEVMPTPHAVHLAYPEFARTVVDRHKVWAPVGNRVATTLGSCVFLDEADLTARESA